MLAKIDQHIINHQKKQKLNRYQKFAESKWGFILATLFGLKQSVDETMIKREEGELVMSAVFLTISVLLALFAIRHIFFRKKIERFEYRMKVVEAPVVLYVGLQKWSHIWFVEGIRDLRAYMLPMFTIVLFVFYLLMARLIFLKHSGKIEHVHI